MCHILFLFLIAVRQMAVVGQDIIADKSYGFTLLPMCLCVRCFASEMSFFLLVNLTKL